MIDSPPNLLRLAKWMIAVSGAWILWVVIFVGIDTFEFATTGQMRGRGNSLRFAPTLIRVVTPCNVPIFGPANGLPSLTVAYGYWLVHLFVSLRLIRAGIMIHRYREYRFVRRSIAIGMLPFIGPWHVLFWILGVKLYFTLSEPEIRSRFTSDLEHRTEDVA